MKSYLSRIFIIVFMIIVSLQTAVSKRKVENFTLKDYYGVNHTLSDFRTSKAIVLMFIATQCPVSNAYNTRMVQLYRDFASKGVEFIGINANKQESIDEIKEHAKEHNFEFLILKDWDNIVADKLNASVTPEIFVLNPHLEIIYHGRIDDSRREEKVNARDLRMVLDEILAGKPVDVQETKAFGCSIKRVN